MPYYQTKRPSFARKTRTLRKELTVHRNNTRYVCVACGTANYTEDNCRECGAPFSWQKDRERGEQIVVKYSEVSKLRILLWKLRLVSK